MRKVLPILFLLVPLFVQAQTGIITTICGNGHNTDMGDGGMAISAEISADGYGIFDVFGNYYFTVGPGNRIRKIAPSGIITAFAGTGAVGYTGDGGPASAATLRYPKHIAADKLGNVYIADAANSCVRKVDATTGIISTVAGNGTSGYSGDGYAATAALLGTPYSLCIDTFGNIYIGDQSYSTIRKINTLGIISTVANVSMSVGCTGDGGPATAAELSDLEAICVDQHGNIYATCGFTVRRIDVTTGIITTIAGNGIEGYTGEGVLADTTEIAQPFDMHFDANGNLYLAERNNNRVRKIDTFGYINTVVGNGTPAFAGDGGLATAAEIYWPEGVAFDACGNLYVNDLGNFRIRKVTYPGTLGISSSSISVAASPSDTVCAGTSVTFSAIAGGGGRSPAYYWFVNGTIVSGATGSVYTYTPAARDSVYCMLYTGIPCTTNPTVNSNVVHMVVNPDTVPTIAISASPSDTVCAGTVVTIHSTISGGGAAATYQWFVNGSLVSVATSYAYTPAAGDAVFCTFTTSNPCTSPASVTSATLHMTVNAIDTPTISIAATPGDTICAGTIVTMHSAITGGGISPSYRWYINTVLTGVISSIYTYSPTAGDSARCVLTSSAACASPAVVNSEWLHFVVNPTVTPSISISVTPSDTVCSITPVTFSAVTTGGGTVPGYQWLVNGVASGASSAYSYLPVDGDSVRCVLTSSAVCAEPAIDSSNTIHMVLHTSVMPEIVITASPADTVCTGAAVTFSTTVSNGGTAPLYQWIKNGSATGTGGASYTYTPANADSVRCILTSNAVCAIDTVVSSNTIDMVVDTFLDPTIAIAGLTTVAVGSTVTVTAVVAGAGSSYTIYWFKNGVEFISTTVPAVTYTKLDGIDTITAMIVPTGYQCIDSATSLQLLVYASNMGVQAVTLAGLSIYPNPASETIYIDGLQAAATYRLFSMVGSVVQQGGLSMGSNRVSVRSLSPGVYVLEVIGEDGEKVVRRVVKE